MSWLEDNWQELLGLGLGAYAGSQGSEDQIVTQRPYLYPGQEQGLTDVIDLARQEYLAGPQQFYPGQQVADLDPNVIAGQNSQLSTTGIQQQLADIAGRGAGQLAQGGAGRIEGFQLPDQIAAANVGERVGRMSAPGREQMGQLRGREQVQRPGGPNLPGREGGSVQMGLLGAQQQFDSVDTNAQMGELRNQSDVDRVAREDSKMQP